jgi:hypothetical protein
MVWPPAVRYTLPSNEPGVPMEQTWAPVLAWVVLHSVPIPGMRTAFFDRLQLRSSLAEAFSSMGLEGDRPWRAAAHVRLLLWLEESPSISLDSKQFWKEPDVRWLAGVNEAAGKTYLNKEQFEELVCWLQLPALLEAARKDAAVSQSIREVETAVSTASRAAKDAGYVLDAFLKLRRGVPTEKQPLKPATSGTGPGTGSAGDLN